jgi:hemerythrin-like metal-binding protein
LVDDSESSSRSARVTQPILRAGDFALGVSEIDGQHQSLFEQVNAFHAAARSGDGNALEAAIGLLETYATYHFAEEEKYMERIGYPGRAQHAAAHRVLTRQLGGIATLMATGGSSPDASLTAAGLLRAWLLDHIVDEDGAVGAYARSLLRAPP